jgi:hypothetical protein
VKEEISRRESIYEYFPDQNSLPFCTLRFGLLCGISQLGLLCQIDLLAESPLCYALLDVISWGYVVWKNESIREVILAHGRMIFLD